MAFDFNNLFKSSKFYYKFDSFFGTEYFPTKDYKKFNYFDVHNFCAGWKYDFGENFSIWLDFKYNDKLFEREILLNKTGISYHKNNFSLSYKIDNLKYGADSYIYNICVKDRFFDQGVIEDYQYIGIESKFNTSHLTFNIKIAANNYHTAILDNSITWKPNQSSAKIYFLFVPRNSEYNAINYSFGTEINLKNDYLSLYESFVYQYLPDHTRGDKIKSLTEVVINPLENLSIGSNFFCEGFSRLCNWQSQNFIKFDYRKLSNYLIFRYNYMNEFNKAEINREFTLLNQFNISRNFSTSLCFSYFNPSFDKEYFQFGVQAKIEYETD